MQVRILPSAKRDLRDGVVFYEAQDEGVGQYFLQSISLDIESLAGKAGIHRKTNELFRFTAKKFPYWIYYRIDDETVFVVAVLDARQNPDSIIKRESKMD